MKIKKGRKKQKNKQKNYLGSDIIGLITIAIGILLMISLLTNKVGIVGSLVKGMIFSIMGFGGYFMPIMLVSLGIIIVLDKLDKDKIRQIIIICCLFLIFLIALDSKNIAISSFINRIKVSIYLSKLNKGGGIIGSLTGYLFYKLFGLIGGYIVLFFGTTIGLLLLFDVKLNDVYKELIIKIKDITFKKEKHKKLKLFKEEQIQNNIQEESDQLSNNKIEILDYNEKIEDISIENDSRDTKLKHIGEYEKMNNISYDIPPLELLQSPNKQESQDKEYILKNANLIEETMNNFGIKSKITQINRGPTITCYELSPSPGIKLSKIASLADNIALSLASSDIRIEAPIPGKSAVGIEVPNKIKDSVTLKEVLLSEEYKQIKSFLPMALGKDVTGKPIISSVDKMPHLLIAGATGSGKSVCINTIIMSILYKSSPNDVKLLLIDPKVVELSIYNKIPHLLIPVVTEPKKATFAFNWAVGEMENRYKIFAENNVRDIHAYNEKCNLKKIDKIPSIVIIVDELSDLMMVAAQEIEEYICRLAQMARAAGIYLIIATQRPSVDVITGTIKANIPSRISFAVSSQIDSRTILDMGGAEKLLGRGDMLFYPSFFSKPIRIQGAFISDKEVEDIVNFLNKGHKVSHNEGIIEKMKGFESTETFEKDEIFADAVKLVVAEGQASISMLQRKFRIGYARAARMIDAMEGQGIIGGYEGSKPRKVLIIEDDLDKMNI